VFRKLRTRHFPEITFLMGWRNLRGGFFKEERVERRSVGTGGVISGRGTT